MAIFRVVYVPQLLVTLAIITKKKPIIGCNSRGILVIGHSKSVFRIIKMYASYLYTYNDSRITTKQECIVRKV